MRRLLLAGITLLLAANAAAAQRGPMREDDQAPYDRRMPDDPDATEDDGDDTDGPGAFRGPPPDDARPLPRGRRGQPPAGDDDEDED